MKIILNVLVILGFGLALLVITKTFTIPHKEYYDNEEAFIYGKGNAPDSIKEQINAQLHKFQDGYTARDLEKVDSYMETLFSKENVLILGTMPGEIFIGYEEASQLIHDDWAYWGDVKLQMDNANISTKDKIAWVSTIGYVEFDLSRMLVLPLRFTGVLVQEDDTWKFQQAQYQFDLDNLKILITIILLFLMMCVSFIRLLFIIYKEVRNRRR